MASNDSKLHSARERLETVKRQIADHPLSSEQFVQARAMMAERPDEDRETVDAALRERGLPALGTQTKMMATGLASLARLNRRRIRIERRIEKLERTRL